MVKYIISSGRKNKNYQQKINTDMKLIKFKFINEIYKIKTCKEIKFTKNYVYEIKM